MYVTVLDQNDNRPQFSQAVYSGSIMENSRPGITVDMVSADVEKRLYIEICSQ